MGTLFYGIGVLLAPIVIPIMIVVGTIALTKSYRDQNRELTMMPQESRSNDSFPTTSFRSKWRHKAWMVWVLVLPSSWFLLDRFVRNPGEPWLPYSIVFQAFTFTMWVYLIMRPQNQGTVAAWGQSIAAGASFCAFCFFSLTTWLLKTWTG